MSDRNHPHNGRDLGGHFRVKQDDVEDLLTDPEGTDYMEDDVRLGGAVEDTGSSAGQKGEHVEDLIDENRRDVERLVDPD